MRSRGSVEFSRMPGGIVKVSERLGVGASKSSVSAWRRGDSLPSGAMRERIFELGGPDVDSWDEPLAANSDAPTIGALAALGQLAPATQEDTARVSGRLLALAEAQLEEVGRTQDLDLGQRTRITASLFAMVDKLGHHTGIKLTERQILDSPITIRIVDRMLEALKPWPEAERAAADAIDELKAKP